ncbi:unnamed protein product [Caenorhabditis auriculariae]|uniref:Uncharacterized protein n=1 Tax=Caenorhabditis auriculariae TaxID=2777116 RepID=A0A8S1HJX2_9PELO|nr:unnamed protein product [Caenorhabditis auriculariae]
MDKNEEGMEFEAEAVSTSSMPRLARLAAIAFADLIVEERIPVISCPIPALYSNEIVEILRERGQLTGKVLHLLTPQRFQITKIDLSGCGSKFVQSDLTFLHGHTLSSFCLGDIDYKANTNKIQLGEVLSRFCNKKTRAALRHIDLSGRNRITSNWPNYLTKFSSVVSLSIANRVTSSPTLAVLSSLTQLKFLDISNTHLTDISSLGNLVNLEVLLMYNLGLRTGKVINTLALLTKLRVLDISRKTNTDYHMETNQDATIDLAQAFYEESFAALATESGSPWPELRSLDLSGLNLGHRGTESAMNVVQKIIDAHPKLEQIALLATPVEGQLIKVPGRDFEVINAASRANILDALDHYTKRDRPVFAAHALHFTYYILQSNYDEFSQAELGRCLRLVCVAMKEYLMTLPVQIAGSACLYHICKMKRIRRLSKSDVCMCIERSLDAAQTHRNMTQLQKNVWLTICNDYLLHLSGVDFYRTCKVALDTMLFNRDASVERMAIAIVSIVTPKMRTPQTRKLTSDDRYVKHLVKIMNDYLAKFQQQTPRDHDNTLFTLKFTLSALWNLTDECSATCAAFLEAGGVRTAFEILNAFSDHSNVQTKVLGILNNIAEIEDLKLNILCHMGYVQHLLSSLDGDFDHTDNRGRFRHVERSYFAAGVLANILLISEKEWSGSVSRDAVNDALITSVSRWPTLSFAMVSYRSFEPFARIITKSNSDGAILWCLWGVNHVLAHRETNSPSHCAVGYGELLRTSPLLVECRKIVRGAADAVSRHRKVVEFAESVVEVAHKEEQASTELSFSALSCT